MGSLTFLALLSLGITIYITLEVALGLRQMRHIKNVGPVAGKHLPSVSVIIPACNEADTIRPALLSVLAQDYGNLEVMVVNDRSVDGTAKVLEQMRQQYPSLRVEHITSLPRGWLGKNHALQYGADHATGKYLLFTDADVVMEKTTLSRAMGWVLANRLDHISIFFEPVATGALLNALFLEVGAGLMLIFRPWKAKDPQSRRFMGVGAFNLIQAAAYRRVGMHQAVAMHPIDDVMLGKVIKKHGLRQECLLGGKFITVKWYGSIQEMSSGLMKNIYALFGYSTVRVTGALAGLFLLAVLPFWALFFTDGITQILFGAAVFARLFSFALGLRDAGVRPWHAVWSLLTPYVIIYMISKATATTIWKKGIIWRGTHYPLEELKANKI